MKSSRDDRSAAAGRRRARTATVDAMTPSLYTEDTEVVFAHVYGAYPTVPSPHYDGITAA